MVEIKKLLPIIVGGIGIAVLGYYLIKKIPAVAAPKKIAVVYSAGDRASAGIIRSARPQYAYVEISPDPAQLPTILRQVAPYKRWVLLGGRFANPLTWVMIRAGIIREVGPNEALVQGGVYRGIPFHTAAGGTGPLTQQAARELLARRII